MNPRQVILARRARFVAAALAPGCGKERADHVDAGARAVDAGADAGAKPHPCLCICEPGDPLCSCL